jgi:predicted CopG family antitoxin
MDTKEIVIDDDVMEQLREMSKRNGYNLEDVIQKIMYLHSDERKAMAKKEMSPSLAALAGICGKVPEDYDWRKDLEEELCNEYFK